MTMPENQKSTHLCYQRLSENKKWITDTPLAKLQFDDSSLNELIFEKGSLTAALMNLSEGAFDVKVLSQGLGVPYWHEQKKLNNTPTRVAYIREVELMIHGKAVVYARTIIPYSLVGIRLQSLGKTPLGDPLFKNGKSRISKREFALVEGGSHIVKARRTPYDYQGETILVSEFFLPNLNDKLES